jgi:hypothetical protein
MYKSVPEIHKRFNGITCTTQDQYLVELDGIVNINHVQPLPQKPPNLPPNQEPIYRAQLARALSTRKIGSKLIATDVDPRNQIRRGEVSNDSCSAVTSMC